MFDRYQREIHYLRLSVTDLCNLRCRYCMPDGVEKLEREAVLTYEEFLRLAALFAQCGIDTVRVTGGEPLVRKNVAQLVAGLKATPGMPQRARPPRPCLNPCKKARRKAAVAATSSSRPLPSTSLPPASISSATTARSPTTRTERC